MNRKWLLKEMRKWQNENIIDADCAEILSKRYGAKSGSNTLTIIFSVLGSLLIGSGIILILAKNWYLMPAAVKTVLSVLPLLTGQGLAVFTVLKKQNSLAWREGVAIFYTAGVFTALAMVSQSFHISNDFGIYVLECGLLSLPIVYLLDAVSPLAVYYYTIINWGFLRADEFMYNYHGSANYWGAFLLILFSAAGLLYVVLNRKKAGDIRHIYTIWISVIAGGVLVAVFSSLMNLKELDFAVLYLLYFAFLFAFDKNREGPLLPFNLIGALGSLAVIMIFSFAWDEFYLESSNNLVISIVPLAGIMLLGIWNHKSDKKRLQFLSAVVLFTILLIISSYFSSEYFIAVAANLIAGIIGISFIVTGAKNSNLPITNLGLIVTCGLILMRFFDSNIDSLWRGIAFLILGGIFLFINFYIVNKRKQEMKDKEVPSI